MLSLMWRSLRVVTACVLVTMFAVPPNLMAQAHVVSPRELQKHAVAASRARQQNLEILRQFLSGPKADEAIKTAHADARQVKAAIANLSDEELARLASRAQKAQADFAAGNISDHDLLIILVVVIIIVLIVVAVHH